MTYATQADMVDRFGEAEVAQRTNRTDGLTIDTAVLERALTDADAEINSYLAAHYSLPLPSTPAVLVRLACDIARHSLYDVAVTETIRTRYEDVVSLLRRFASGDVRLEGMVDVADAGIDTAYHAFTPRAITTESLRGFA